MCMKHHLGSQGPSNTISNTSLTEPVTSGLPTMLRMRNLGSADQVTGSIRIVVTGSIRIVVTGSIRNSLIRYNVT